MVAAVSATHRMPLWYYVTLHPDASLSREELAALIDWSQHAADERAPASDSPP